MLARRKPLLLFRLVGLFLLRLAERRLSGLLLFHEPPRRTRLDGADQAPGRDETRGPEAEEIHSPSAEFVPSLSGMPKILTEHAPKKMRSASGGED